MTLVLLGLIVLSVVGRYDCFFGTWRDVGYGVGDGYRTRDLLSHSQAFCH